MKLLRRFIASGWRKISLACFLLWAFLLSKINNRNEPPSPVTDLAFLVEEFFHEDLRGFGGYGKVVKNVSEYFNGRKSTLRTKVFLTSRGAVPRIEKKSYHNTDVFFLPSFYESDLPVCARSLKLVNYPGRKLFVAIDFLPSYFQPLFVLPSVPLLLWFQAPLDPAVCEKNASVPLGVEGRGVRDLDELRNSMKRREWMLNRILFMSRVLKRKIIFAVIDPSITERVKSGFGLPELTPHHLPCPIFLPETVEIRYAEKPSLCFLGRLDPVKRPWIVFELAKRFKQVDFHIAGVTTVPDVMNPVINRYRGAENLKFHGLVDGARKRSLLEQCWGLINTSVTEGWPVSFLESFSYGKPVISCQNPGGLVEKYGSYTGEIPGEGNDPRSLDIFSEKIEKLISDRETFRQRGQLAKQYALANCSFERFEKRLREIFISERIFL